MHWTVLADAFSVLADACRFGKPVLADACRFGKPVLADAFSVLADACRFGKPVLADACHFGKPVLADAFSVLADAVLVNQSRQMLAVLVNQSRQMPAVLVNQSWQMPAVLVNQDRVQDKSQQHFQQGGIYMWLWSQMHVVMIIHICGYGHPYMTTMSVSCRGAYTCNYGHRCMWLWSEIYVVMAIPTWLPWASLSLPITIKTERSRACKTWEPHH